MVGYDHASVHSVGYDHASTSVHSAGPGTGMIMRLCICMAWGMIMRLCIARGAYGHASVHSASVGYGSYDHAPVHNCSVAHGACTPCQLRMHSVNSRMCRLVIVSNAAVCTRM